MTDSINNRKIEHLYMLKEEPNSDRCKFYFDNIHLRHSALPDIDLDEIDTSISMLGKRLSFPLVISSMTGGDHALINKVNRNLAIAAERTGVAMGVGSQRVMFTSAKARKSFELRRYAPSTLLFSNLGAIQLNYGLTVDMCEEAVDIIGANALYLHLNPLQEAIQKEGNTNFFGISEKIGYIASKIETPIILKEVGCGISVEDVKKVVSFGVNMFDVAGSGGTSWSRVESARYKKDREKIKGRVFQDWGIPTPQALFDLKNYNNKLTLIASGGVRNGIDMVKAMILGASLSGIARPFLEPAMLSSDAVIDEIELLKQQFQTAMFLLGIDSTTQLIGNEDFLIP